MADKREQHNAYMREKIFCDKCNGHYTRVNKQKHLNSTIHKKNTNDKHELELYLNEIKRKYDQKIEKIEKERDSRLHEIDKKIKIINI
jgi:hypothetical protein